MERRFVLFVSASAVFMTVLLLIDRDGLASQLALGVATAAFLWLFVRRMDVDGRQVIICILVATTGEVVLSIGWGLYSYAHALIPLYVPPGHGLFYSLAVVTARQAIFHERSEAITRGVVVAGSLLALISLIAKNDTWGFLWWLGALALIHTSRNRLLLASCFVYTMILEWVGTAIGNWRWAAEVPGVGLHSANPPAGVGILYILLDLIVVGITVGVARLRGCEVSGWETAKPRNFATPQPVTRTDSPPSAPCAIPAYEASGSPPARTAHAHRA